jgi:polycomb protein EED
VALFGGEGHKSPVLAIHFHPNGKWLLSGGIDTAICLWAVPSLEDLNRNGSSSTQRKEPMIVYYPHFFSKELHFNFVDSLAFFGDLIISRASKDQDAKGNKSNSILIWKIEGFDSDDPPPASPPIPVHGQQTRSSFPHESGFRGFKRMLTLNMPDTDRFYHRFGLLHVPGLRPILAMGNQTSAYSFWDLQKLHEGIDKSEKRGGRKKGGTAAVGKSKLSTMSMTSRSESIAESTRESLFLPFIRREHYLN